LAKSKFENDLQISKKLTGLFDDFYAYLVLRFHYSQYSAIYKGLRTKVRIANIYL